VEIRVCIDADLDALRSGWPTGDDIAGSHFQEQASGNATFLCAWDSDGPLGWCARGVGVGTALLAEAEALAGGRMFRQLAVSVDRENGDAARLYLRLGFQPTGVIDAITYSWLDDQGARHTETETSEILVKQLR
jgi:GNAT superfamily N-acetyltransferase